MGVIPNLRLDRLYEVVEKRAGISQSETELDQTPFIPFTKHLYLNYIIKFSYLKKGCIAQLTDEPRGPTEFGVQGNEVRRGVKISRGPRRFQIEVAIR